MKNFKPHLKKEILITLLFFIITLVSILMFILHIYRTYVESTSNKTFLGIEIVVFFLLMILLIYGGLVYQLSRFGYFMRLTRHTNTSIEKLESFAYDSENAPSLTILIPSYKEQHGIINQTLMSAALQEYHKKRIVLLIDDPSDSGIKIDIDKKNLKLTKRLVKNLNKLFSEQKSLLVKKYDNFLLSKNNNSIDFKEETRKLSNLNFQISVWFKNQSEKYNLNNATNKLFVASILKGPGNDYLRRSSELFDLIDIKEKSLSIIEIEREYKKLIGLFSVELTYFQRKRYINLSHEPNKAMNINTYIHLMGDNYKEVRKKDGLYIIPTNKNPSICISDSDYLITLDADSLLLSEYALRLIYFMERPQNRKVAVSQTPYTSIPKTNGTLERIAGATTDIQYIIHQGFTFFNATYWVGANAVIRKKSLEDIKTIEYERGFEIKRYIQDRTVIEDTESTIDLVNAGWILYNHPERLSYSATPSDFGSLIIQRRRWANGGLIILPKLINYLLRKIKNVKYALSSGFMRIHYLASISFVNIGILILLFYVFDDRLINPWIFIISFSYYYLYWRDLVQNGYKKNDIFRVYALNLLLIPINIGGVLKSLQQGLTRKKIPFGRTPKIDGRTSAPLIYILAEYLLLILSLTAFIFDAYSGRWIHATYAGLNALFFIYVIKLIGFRESIEDIFLIFKRFKFKKINLFTRS